MSPLFVEMEKGKWYVRFYFWGECLLRQKGGPFDTRAEAVRHMKAISMIDQHSHW